MNVTIASGKAKDSQQHLQDLEREREREVQRQCVSGTLWEIKGTRKDKNC
jgi:hypothetical protein